MGGCDGKPTRNFGRMPRNARKSNKRKRPSATKDDDEIVPPVPHQQEALNDNFSSSGASSSSDSDDDSDADQNSTSSSATLDATMISNYKTIPVNILSPSATTNHTLHLYLRVHQNNKKNDSSSSSTASPTQKTIFVTNFPSCTTDTDVTTLFHQLGATAVNSVQFVTLAGRAPKPTKPDGWPMLPNIDLNYALVTLTSSSQVKKIMNWVPLGGSNTIEWVVGNSEDGSATNQVSAWVQGFQRRQPTMASALEKADYYMKTFMATKETLRDELDARRGTKDEDGFQLVSKKHTARSSGNTRASKRRGRTRNKKNGAGTELKDFYRFQLRENKRNKLSELRERFNEDKERVEHLRSNKKFKIAARETE